MSSPFSIHAANLFDAAALEQIRKAYNQRRAALHQSPRYWTGSAWANGDIAMAAGLSLGSASHNLVAEIQQWIMDYCGYFLPYTVVDYNNTDAADFKRWSEIAADASYADAFEYLCKTIDWGTLFDQVDLFSGGTYGFRRMPMSTGTETRGVAQAGDYWWHPYVESGWSVWREVCAFLSILKVTELAGGTGYDNAITLSTTATVKGRLRFGDDSSVYSVAQAEYDADDPGTSTAADPQAYYMASTSPFLYEISSQSSVVDYYVAPSVAAKASAIKLYFNAQAYGLEFSAHGLPVIENKLAEVTTLSAGSGGVLNSPVLLQVRFASDFITSGFVDSPGHGFQAATNPWWGIVVWNFDNSDL